MHNRIWHWLSHTPTPNEIDRRNGAFFQLFLVCFSVTIFTREPSRYINADVQREYLAKAWGRVLPWPRVGMYIDFASDVAIAIACIAAFILVRKGRFREGVRLYLGSMLGILTISYLAFGSITGEDYAHVLLIVAALLLGRKALWVVYGVTIVNFTLGTCADSFAHFYRTGQHGFNYRPIANVAANLFVITALLDQAVKTIRDSLTEAERRGDRLAAEIIEREKTQRQVVHLEKMRVVGQLASGTAHDFNNILGVILGFARECRRPGSGAPKTARERALCEALEGVEVAARRGANVSRKLLDFSRTEVTRAKAFDVVEALRDVKPMLRQLLPENVRLSIETPPDTTVAYFDRDQFELALLNLAANSRDAMPDGGTCTITLAREADGWIAVSLADTGEGMSEDTRQRVFEPFFTTKPVGIGTGLGLSVVHGLVERNGGRMSIESTPGKGTSVTLWLRHALAEREPAQPTGDDDIRVLLIDDDDLLRGLLVSSLEDYGYHVKAAHDGRSALKYADDASDPPHVIVCDHHMPDMDGTTVMRHLRDRFPGVPAILISTNAPADAQDAPSMAPNYRLPKPFSPDRLATQIYEIVGQKK